MYQYSNFCGKITQCNSIPNQCTADLHELRRQTKQCLKNQESLKQFISAIDREIAAGIPKAARGRNALLHNIVLQW